MHELTIHFTDQFNSSIHVQVTKSDFITSCKKLDIQFFVRMLEDFDESTKSEIEIQVPYADTMKSIIKYITDGEFEQLNVMNSIKRIYCMDYIGIDFMTEFAKLLDVDIDSIAYDLVHQFIDQKEYANELYIRFMATKLPDDYDCSGFSKELIDAMLDITKEDYIILQNNERIIIYRIEDNHRITINIQEFVPITTVAINMIESIIAIGFKNTIELHSIYTGDVIGTIVMPDPIMNPMIFSSDGLFLHTYTKRKIRTYCSRTQKMIKTFVIPNGIDKCIFSPDGKSAIYRFYISMDKKSARWYLLSLTDGVKHLLPDTDGYSKIMFFDNLTIAVKKHDNMNDFYLYDCKNMPNPTIKKYTMDATIQSVFHGKTICHADSNIFIRANDDHFIRFQIIQNTIVGSSHRTYDDPFYRSRNCLSPDNTHIYTIEECHFTSRIVKYKLDQPEGMTKVKKYPIESDKIFYYKQISCIASPDYALAKKINRTAKRSR